MGHLAKINLAENENIREDNLCKAERHIKRSGLDCYKYMCVSYQDQYKDFDKKYKHVDLSEINNGTFLPELCRLKSDSVNALKTAKLKELSIEIDDDEIFSAYEEAYNQYSDLVNFIIDNQQFIDRAKHKHWKHIIIDVILGICTVWGVVYPLIQQIIKFIYHLINSN